MTKYKLNYDNSINKMWRFFHSRIKYYHLRLGTPLTNVLLLGMTDLTNNWAQKHASTNELVGVQTEFMWITYVTTSQFYFVHAVVLRASRYSIGLDWCSWFECRWCPMCPRRIILTLWLFCRLSLINVSSLMFLLVSCIYVFNVSLIWTVTEILWLILDLYSIVDWNL